MEKFVHVQGRRLATRAMEETVHMQYLKTVMILKMALLGSNKCFFNSFETSWWDSKWGCTDSGLKGKNISYYNGGIVGTSDLKYKAFIWNQYYT
jgi:hypothetical protein